MSNPPNDSDEIAAHVERTKREATHAPEPPASLKPVKPAAQPGDQSFNLVKHLKKQKEAT